PIVRIHFLGAMRATTFLGADMLPRGRKARAVLGYLCLAGGERILRSRLAAMLWDRMPDAQARANLRQALRDLSSATGPLADERLTSDHDTVTLNTHLCWIDAVSMVAQETNAPACSRGDLAGLCAGELLEELNGTSAAFDHWLVSERTRFNERLSALL